jgi:hypothetical protein
MAVIPSGPARALDTTARRASGPAVAAVAGLAGGLALGARASSRRRKVLGLPIGPKRRGVGDAVRLLAAGAQQLGSASQAADDLHQIREQLAASNRRSPIEIVLDALTHRRGAHRLEQ